MGAFVELHHGVACVDNFFSWNFGFVLAAELQRMHAFIPEEEEGVFGLRAGELNVEFFIAHAAEDPVVGLHDVFDGVERIAVLCFGFDFVRA